LERLSEQSGNQFQDEEAEVVRGEVERLKTDLLSIKKLVKRQSSEIDRLRKALSSTSGTF